MKAPAISGTWKPTEQQKTRVRNPCCLARDREGTCSGHSTGHVAQRGCSLCGMCVSDRLTSPRGLGSVGEEWPVPISCPPPPATGAWPAGDAAQNARPGTAFFPVGTLPTRPQRPPAHCRPSPASGSHSSLLFSGVTSQGTHTSTLSKGPPGRRQPGKVPLAGISAALPPSAPALPADGEPGGPGPPSLSQAPITPTPVIYQMFNFGYVTIKTKQLAVPA